MPNLQKGFAPITIILGIVLILSIAGGAYYFSKNLKTTVKNNPVITPTPTPTPTVVPKADETATWKTYTGETVYTSDGSSSFTIKYPAHWLLEGNVLYPLGKKADKGLETRIVLGGGGFGAPGPQTKNIYPAGEAGYYWAADGMGNIFAYATFPIGKHSYIFYVYNLPASYSQEYKQIFSLMLSTFKVVEPNLGNGKYTCPENGYQNCMPILDAEGQKQCSKEALDWKKANCPNFSGAAY